MKLGAAVALTLASLTLGGCTLAKFHTIDDKASALVDEHAKLLKDFQQQQIDMPESKRIEVKKADAWLLSEFNVDYSKQPFRSVLANMFPGYPIVYDDRIPLDYDPPVVAPPSAKTVQDHLNGISLQTNLGWSQSQGVITISPNVSKNYDIPVYGSFGDGKALSTSISMSHDNLGNDKSGGSGFENLVAGVIAPYAELASLVVATTGATTCGQNAGSTIAIPAPEPVRSPGACYSISGAGNMLTLTARPRQQEVFQHAYNAWYGQVNAQVQLVLRVLLFDVTDMAQQNIDVSLLRSAAISAVGKTNNAGFVAFDQSANGITFNFNEGNRFQGSQLIINALNQIGKTYITDTKEIMARNNQMVSIFNEEVTPYLASVSIQQTNSGSTSLNTPTFVTKELTTGQAVNILPTISGDGVGLRMVINEKALGKTNVFDFSSNNNVLKSEIPSTTGTGVTFSRRLENHQIALLTSTNRITYKIDSANNDIIPISSLRSGQNRTFTTLYMIEVNIVR